VGLTGVLLLVPEPMQPPVPQHDST
jgi:hypothetical protein